MTAKTSSCEPIKGKTTRISLHTSEIQIKLSLCAWVVFAGSANQDVTGIAL